MREHHIALKCSEVKTTEMRFNLLLRHWSPEYMERLFRARFRETSFYRYLCFTASRPHIDPSLSLLPARSLCMYFWNQIYWSTGKLKINLIVSGAQPYILDQSCSKTIIN